MISYQHSEVTKNDLRIYSTKKEETKRHHESFENYFNRFTFYFILWKQQINYWRRRKFIQKNWTLIKKLAAGYRMEALSQNGSSPWRRNDSRSIHDKHQRLKRSIGNNFVIKKYKATCLNEKIFFQNHFEQNPSPETWVKLLMW